MATEHGSTAVSNADCPQFRLRSLFGGVFWIAVLLAATARAPWQLTPTIVVIWLATLILYQAIPGRMRRERTTIALLAALGSAVPIAMLGVAAPDPPDPHPVVPAVFEATAWKSADPIGGSRTVRSQMIDDLLQRYHFRGWKSDDVIELLGPPDRRPPAMRLVHIVYRLGAERGAWALDDEYLYFRLDAQNRVTEWGLTVD